MGHLGSRELAAASLAITFVNSVGLTTCHGIASALETTVSQANGAGRHVASD